MLNTIKLLFKRSMYIFFDFIICTAFPIMGVYMLKIISVLLKMESFISSVLFWVAIFIIVLIINFGIYCIGESIKLTVKNWGDTNV